MEENREMEKPKVPPITESERKKLLERAEKLGLTEEEMTSAALRNYIKVFCE
jgi:hypothetical protein